MYGGVQNKSRGNPKIKDIYTECVENLGLWWIIELNDLLLVKNKHSFLSDEFIIYSLGYLGTKLKL